jgi:hypothetical protein
MSMVRSVGNLARSGEIRNVYNTLIAKPEEKRPLVRTRRTWEDNTRMDLTEIGCEIVDWMHLL